MELAGGRIATISGAVLTGGASSRMGRDKSRMPVGGVPAATRVARVLAELFEEVLLVGGDPPEDAPGRRVPDVEGPDCSLRGLASALVHSGCEAVLVVATDLPLVTPDLLLALAAWPRAEAVVPLVGGLPQPLCALYQRERVLPRARARLAGDDLSLRGLLRELEVSNLGDAALTLLEAERVLVNVNTPESLARAEALLGAEGGSP